MQTTVRSNPTVSGPSDGPVAATGALVT